MHRPLVKPGQIVHGNCVEVMAQLKAACVDLVVTSPPYDDLRDYKGYEFDSEAVIASLHRVLKPGGVVCWVVGDRFIDGDRTLTSFKQALAFKEAGFKCHDIIVWEKANTPFPRQGAYTQAHELVFVMSIGKPKTFNPITKPAVGCGKRRVRARKKDGSFDKQRLTPDTQEGDPIPLTNVWKITIGGSIAEDKRAFEHPAIFPEELASRCIKSWSNPGDLVLDPMCGSGTTPLCASMLNRSWIGIDISEEFCELARSRCATLLG